MLTQDRLFGRDNKTEHTEKHLPFLTLFQTQLCPCPRGHMTMDKSLPLENKVGTCFTKLL